jgi:hypothetical protein
MINLKRSYMRRPQTCKEWGLSGRDVVHALPFLSTHTALFYIEA